MSVKETAIKKVLFDSYISETTIRIFLGCSKKVAQNIFKDCKDDELEREKYDIRPNHVQSKTLFKITGKDYNFTLKQFKARKDLQNETK